MLVLWAAFTSTVVESLPISEWLDDNFTVPLVAGATCLLLETAMV